MKKFSVQVEGEREQGISGDVLMLENPDLADDLEIMSVGDCLDIGGGASPFTTIERLA